MYSCGAIVAPAVSLQFRSDVSLTGVGGETGVEATVIWRFVRLYGCDTEFC